MKVKRYRSVVPGTAGGAMLVQEGMRRALTLPYHLQDWTCQAIVRFSGEVFALAPESVIVAAPRPLPCPAIDPHQLEIVQHMRVGDRWQVRAALVAVNGIPTSFTWTRKGEPLSIDREGAFSVKYVYGNVRRGKGDFMEMHLPIALIEPLGNWLSGEAYE